MRRVYRYEVPVDDQVHKLPLSGRIVHMDCKQRPDVVEVWAEDTGGPVAARTFRVFGTGQELPDDAIHRGTAVVVDKWGRLVWHLYEVQS